jgi:hypothetical protein
MKSNRNEIKDQNDCKIMEALIENDRFKEIFLRLKQKLFYVKVNTKVKIIEILTKIGIYENLRVIIKGKRV